MFRLPMLLTVCVLAIGCSESTETGSATPNAPATDGTSQAETGPAKADGPPAAQDSVGGVPATDATSRMIGTWGVDGQVSLTVSREDGQLVLTPPENEMWRMEISGVVVDGDSVRFVQKHYLHSGDPHPFSGVACNTIIRLIDDDTMELTMTTVHMPEGESASLSRME